MSRTYFPIQAVGFAQNGASFSAASSFRAAKGVQTLGCTTTFNLEQIYELGQISLYENIENLPNIDITLEKVVDGYALLQHLATPQAVSPTLAGRYNDNRCEVAVALYPLNFDSASGTPLSYMFLSGMYVSSINWSIPIQGNITESVGLTCNDKTWYYAASGTPWNGTTQFANTDTPVLASGGVNRRENVNMSLSRWPRSIPGISQGGTFATGINPTGLDGQYKAHLQNVSISVSMGRTDLLELGRRAPYFRYLNLPAEVSTTIEVTPIAGSGDQVNAISTQDNTQDETIYIVLDAGTRIDLGNKNRLSSITQQGGGTDGSNVSLSYAYVTFNDYICRQSANDPAGL